MSENNVSQNDLGPLPRARKCDLCDKDANFIHPLTSRCGDHVSGKLIDDLHYAMVAAAKPFKSDRIITKG